MTRAEMIERLVDFEIARFFERGDMADYMSYIFRTGVVGFDEYTDEELKQECEDYGLNEGGE